MMVTLTNLRPGVTSRTLPRRRRRRPICCAAVAVALAVGGLSGCSDDGSADAAPDDGGGAATTDTTTTTTDTTTTDTVTEVEAAEAAAALCPVMLAHLSAIGAAFNDAAGDVAGIDGAAERRARWLDALDEMTAANSALRDELAAISVPVLEPVVRDILDGADASDGEIEDIRALFEEDPSIDEQRHQMRTSQVIVRVEKVTSDVKPEMNDYGSPVLNGAFREYDNCRNAVREVDDGATSDL